MDDKIEPIGGDGACRDRHWLSYDRLPSTCRGVDGFSAAHEPVINVISNGGSEADLAPSHRIFFISQRSGGG